MNRLPVKLILYEDLCGTSYMRLALEEKADDIVMDLMLASYMNVQIWCAGTPYETMFYLGNEQ